MVSLILPSLIHHTPSSQTHLTQVLCLLRAAEMAQWVKPDDWNWVVNTQLPQTPEWLPMISVRLLDPPTLLCLRILTLVPGGPKAGSI